MFVYKIISKILKPNKIKFSVLSDIKLALKSAFKEKQVKIATLFPLHPEFKNK